MRRVAECVLVVCVVACTVAACERQTCELFQPVDNRTKSDKNTTKQLGKKRVQCRPRFWYLSAAPKVRYCRKAKDSSQPPKKTKDVGEVTDIEMEATDEEEEPS